MRPGIPKAPAPRPYAGESYHGQPSVKASHWDWTVSTYIFLAGLGGAAQAIATLAHALHGPRFGPLRRNARVLGTVGTAIGSALLIKDLKTPQRFYNMLRIFRPTSPMSFGTYILAKFGALSGFALLGDIFPRSRALGPVTNAAQIGAALTGAGAATYTASLLSATSNPFWAATPRALGIKFAASSVAIGAAALSAAEQLAGRPKNARPLDDLAAIATAVHLGAAIASKTGRERTGVGSTMHNRRETRTLETADLLIAGALPLVAYALNRTAGGRGAALSLAASSAVLAGGFLVRHQTLYAGHAAAEKPDAYLRFAQPDNLPPPPPDRPLAGALSALTGAT
jgi:protein NrfD